jgi:DNA mismatch endonuclease, patch repair protein
MLELILFSTYRVVTGSSLDIVDLILRSAPILELSTFRFNESQREGDVADRFSKEQRSAAMAAVKSINTKPELFVRSALHRAGFRFRIHPKPLPGRPDIVLPKFRVAVFVHGCFWHGHDCPRGKRPTSNVKFWTAKIDANIRRDALATTQLRTLGWKVRTIWSCSLSGSVARLVRELQDARRRAPPAERRSTELAK